MSLRTPPTAARRSLVRRLLPLHVAIFLQGFVLWVPIEKLFMDEIGFDAASVGVMAAAYAAIIPLVEIPSGVLADRWSRRGVLVVASIASAAFALIGGLSDSVPAYIASTLLFGVYFAMYSGTIDAVVYDTVVEETGDSTLFERRTGRIRMLESVALVSSSLAGGWIAGLAAPRLTYFLTVPIAALSIVALLRFREPQLHKADQPEPLRRHLALTYRTLTRQRRLLPVITLAMLATLLLQTVFEFGPLWLVALGVPAVLYGPYWAVLMAALGVAGLLAGRLRLDRPVPLAGVIAAMISASVVLTMATGVVLVTITQVALALAFVLASIYVTRLLHDAVPSAIRTGVASGVGGLSWIAFVPFALGFGLISKALGVHAAGWLIVAATAVVGVLLVLIARRPSADVLPAQSFDAARTDPGPERQALAA